MMAYGGHKLCYCRQRPDQRLGFYVTGQAGLVNLTLHMQSPSVQHDSSQNEKGEAEPRPTLRNVVLPSQGWSGFRQKGGYWDAKISISMEAWSGEKTPLSDSMDGAPLIELLRYRWMFRLLPFLLLVIRLMILLLYKRKQDPEGYMFKVRASERRSQTLTHVWLGVQVFPFPQPLLLPQLLTSVWKVCSILRFNF